MSVETTLKSGGQGPLPHPTKELERPRHLRCDVAGVEKSECEQDIQYDRSHGSDTKCSLPRRSVCCLSVRDLADFATKMPCHCLVGPNTTRSVPEPLENGRLAMTRSGGRLERLRVSQSPRLGTWRAAAARFVRRAADVFVFRRSRSSEFLFAPVGTEANGMTLSGTASGSYWWAAYSRWPVKRAF
jgi:hypothetical protein